MATPKRRRKHRKPQPPVLDPAAVVDNGRKAKRQSAGPTFGGLIGKKKLSSAAKATKGKSYAAVVAAKFATDRAVGVLRDTSVPVLREEDVTAEHGEEVMELVSDGDTVSGACRMLNISVRAFLMKVSKSPELALALARAREDGAESRIAEADITLKRVLKERRSGALISAANNYASHCRWVAAHLKPKAWGDRLDLGGVSGAPLVIQVSKDDDAL